MTQDTLPVTQSADVVRAAPLGIDGTPPVRHLLFLGLCLAALVLPLLVLALLITSAVHTALPRLGWDFLTGYPSRHAISAGILPAVTGSAALLVLTALLAVPVGVGAAIYLEEYARPTKLTSIIEVNISNLAGVPSILY